MATVVYGNDATFSDVLYGATPPSILGYLNHSIEQAKQFGEIVGNSFIQNSVDCFNRFNNSEATKAARRIAEKIQSTLGGNVFKYLTNVDELQTAPTIMLPYIMAHPLLTSLYQKQQCDGYGDRFNSIGGDSSYIRHQIEDGWVYETEDGYEYTHYIDDVHPSYERTLTHEEQCIIHTAWNTVEKSIFLGRDPTSEMDASL